MSLKNWIPCPDSLDNWGKYELALNGAPGTALIGRKEWRDGFGAVVSQDGGNIVLTGARVDDNGLVKVSGVGSTDVDEHNDLMHVMRSLDQTHLSSGAVLSDSAPDDPNWHEFGMDPVTFTDPGESNLDQLQVTGVEVDASFNSVFVVVKIRGDEQEVSEAYINYRRKGTSVWTRGPQLRGIHGVSADAHINLDRHISGPLLRLAPGTTYEFQVVIEHDADIGSGTSWQNPLSLPVYEAKTRHQPYAPKDGQFINIIGRTNLLANLGLNTVIPGGHMTIQAGDYTLPTDTDGTQTMINVSGTKEQPLLIEGVGEVTIPRVKITGSWVILHNVKVANHTNYSGDFVAGDNSASTIVINDTSSEGIVLSKVDTIWHTDLPQTWEEAYRLNLNYDMKHYKIYGVPGDGGPDGPSPKWTVIENCDLTEGPKKSLEDIWNHQTRPVEWIGHEGFDIRHQSLTMRKCNIINNYDNSLTGVGSGNGLASFARLENNFFALSHDDVLEMEKGQGGNILLDNMIAATLAINSPLTGGPILPPTNTQRTSEWNINSVTDLGNGEWEVAFDEGVPEKRFAVLWQGGKVWARKDQTSPVVFTSDLSSAHPGNDDIYATSSDSIVVGTCRITTSNRTPFGGSNTISVQDSTTGTLPNWLVGLQHTGIHETGTPDSPNKWKQNRAGNFVNTFQVTMRGCAHMQKPGFGGGYYYVNNTFMLGQTAWDNMGTSSIDTLGDWYGTPYKPYGMMDYNAYYNNNTTKRYWGNKSLSALFTDFGIDEHSHDYEDRKSVDNALSISYDNMWDEVARANRDMSLYRPNWTYTTYPLSGGTMGPAALGTYKPLRAKATVDSRNYGTGVPMSDPIAKVVGPSIDSSDDVTFLGAVNKTEDRTDVAPHQALMGSAVSGTVSVESYENYSLPDGWTSEDPENLALISSLGITPKGGTKKLLLVNAAQTVGLLVEKE